MTGYLDIIVIILLAVGFMVERHLKSIDENVKKLLEKIPNLR